MRVYVASSWRNELQPGVVDALREAGHEVYDFRFPVPGRRGPTFDRAALESCEACVLVLPCGRSAHLDFGHAAGAGKRTIVLIAEGREADLMYRTCSAVCISLDEVLAALDPPAAIHKEEPCRPSAL